jgi:putative toxin-antitoxin system antitoxin component (TIGR02293 family)
MMPIEKKTANILQKYQGWFNNDIALVANSKKGLRPQAVFDFISLSEFPFSFIEKVLNKTMKTFASYKKNRIALDPIISEKLLKIFSLYQKGVTVFGTVDEFNSWLAAPAFGLGKAVPKDLLDTITGISLVSEELSRIKHGDLA